MLVLVGFGVFTGLLSGVHINLIASLILVYFGFFLNYVDVFILVMSVTHTFIDFIPSIIYNRIYLN